MIASDQGETLRVLWTVSAFHIGEQALWGEAEAGQLLFKPLDMTSSSITFDGQRCTDIRFDQITESLSSYLARRFQTTPQALGIIEGDVTVIRTSCSLPGFDEFVRLSDRKLLVFLHGVYFIFKPSVNY